MLKALIVDDEINSRLYLAALMQAHYPEIELIMAENPADAIAIIAHTTVQVIMLDVEMPGMTGLEMLKQLRQTINNTPVIFVSGYKRPEFIQSAMRLNAIDYLDKPVDPYELKFSMDKVLLMQQTQAITNTASPLRVLSELGEMYFQPHEVLYFQSHGRYAKIVFAGKTKTVLLRINLRALVDVLPKQHFARVSRQYIVNTAYIKFVSQSNHSITLIHQNEKTTLYRIYPQYFKHDIMHHPSPNEVI